MPERDDLHFPATACTVCGKPVDRRTGQCCGRACCMVCGLPNTARCPHLVADYRWRRWEIPGLGRRMPYLEPPIPADTDLDWSDREYRAALGVATAEARLVWKSGAFQTRNDIRLRLIRETGSARFVPHDPPKFWNATQTAGAWFSADPDGFRARLRALADAWRDGREALTRRTPGIARQVARRIACAVGKGSHVAFSPDGSLLLVAGAAAVELRRVDDGALVGRLTTGKNVRTAAFSPCGTRIAVVTLVGVHLTDARLQDVRTVPVASSPVGSGPPRQMHVSTHAVCFGRSGMAVAAGGLVQAFPEERATLREWRLWRPVDAMAVSPDGTRVATLVGERVLVWRTPRPPRATAGAS